MNATRIRIVRTRSGKGRLTSPLMYYEMQRSVIGMQVQWEMFNTDAAVAAETTPVAILYDTRSESSASSHVAPINLRID